MPEHRKTALVVLEKVSRALGTEICGPVLPLLQRASGGVVWVSLFSSPMGVELESFGGEWHYEISPKRGRLHANIKHGFKQQQEILILTLTARGPIIEGQPGFDFRAGLNLGHAVVVNAFLELTSEDAHKFWKAKTV